MKVSTLVRSYSGWPADRGFPTLLPIRANHTLRSLLPFIGMGLNFQWATNLDIDCLIFIWVSAGVIELAVQGLLKLMLDGYTRKLSHIFALVVRRE